MQELHLVHALSKLVDLVLAVTIVSTLDEVDALLVHATVGAGELEGPEEVVDLLELGSDREDFVDHILDADDTGCPLDEAILDDTVRSDGKALGVNLGVSALVDHLAHRLQVRVAVCDVGLNQTKHAQRWHVSLQENSIVDLTETEELEDLLDTGADSVDTTNADSEDQLGLRLNIVVSSGLSLTLEANHITLLRAVLLSVLLSTLEDGLSLGSTLLALLSQESLLLSEQANITLTLLQQRLGHGNSLGRHFSF